MSQIVIKPVPAFQDNYIWLIQSVETQSAWVVDPGESDEVIRILENTAFTLEGILITHHHFDHIQGVKKLKSVYPNSQIIGPKHSKMPWVTHIAKNEDVFTLFDTFSVSCIEVPGHTLDHVAYFGKHQSVKDGASTQRSALFCGDTLFSSGCGRVFEGTAESLYHSLEKLKALDESTEVYCAHEYTDSNLAFCQYLLPNDLDIEERIQEVKVFRSQNLPTLPSTLNRELLVNPFLRCDQPEVAKAVYTRLGIQGDYNPIEVFTQLRKLKDDFQFG